MYTLYLNKVDFLKKWWILLVAPWMAHTVWGPHWLSGGQTMADLSSRAKARKWELYNTPVGHKKYLTKWKFATCMRRIKQYVKDVNFP